MIFSLFILRNVPFEINSILHIVSLATVLVLTAILIFLLTEILLFSEYNLMLLVMTAAISPTVAAGVMVVSSYMLISWYRFNKSSYVVLIFAVAFSINVYAFMYTTIRDISRLMEKDQIITPQTEVVYSSDTYEATIVNDIGIRTSLSEEDIKSYVNEVEKEEGRT